MNVKNMFVFMIIFNFIVAALGSLPIMFSHDPRTAEEADYKEGIELSDNLEEETGTNMGWGTTILKALINVNPFAKYIFALPYFVSMAFGQTGAMGWIVGGLLTLYMFLYAWLVMEIIRGVRLE